MIANDPVLKIFPGVLKGIIQVPPSKSVMQRVLAILFLKNTSLIIHNPGKSDDDLVLINLLKQAGFEIVFESEKCLKINAPLGDQHSFNKVHFGSSGLAARMMTPILAIRDYELALEGSDALKNRPMHFLEQVLPELNVRVVSNFGHLPATIHGPLFPRNIIIDGGLSSQFLTGLLMAFSDQNANNISIKVENLVSKPYIDLTLNVMRDLCMKIPENKNYQEFYFSETTHSSKTFPSTYTIEGDWSAAAFWLVAGAISGAITIIGLDVFSMQADKKILSALIDAGARLSIESKQVSISPSKLKPFHFDATDCPDLFPSLAVLACFANGTSVIEGLGRLVHKESNRAWSIQSELGKMGADITLQNDLMIIKSKSLKGAMVETHQDHRIAMMCAIAALGAESDTTIVNPSVVQKSYPNFFADLQMLGAKLQFSK